MVSQSLDELHLRLQAAVMQLTGGRSFAAPTISVVEGSQQADGRTINGTFHTFAVPVTEPEKVSGLRLRLLILRMILFAHYRSGQITLISRYADALSLIWKGRPPYRISRTFMNALATLTHEEFHAISQDWSRILRDRMLATPPASEFAEGLIELAVQNFLPDVLVLANLGKLRPLAEKFLESRKVYARQREAARAMVENAAGILGKPELEVLKSLMANGGGTIALRMLAHDIAVRTDRKDRYPDRQWFLRRFQSALPPGAERAIVDELSAPFAHLAELAEPAA